MLDPEQVVRETVWPIDRRFGVSVRIQPAGDVVLMYHAVGRSWRSPHSIPTSAFLSHLDRIEEVAHVVPLRDILRDPDDERRRIAITFDDGYRDYHDTVVPLLEERGLPSTVFVSSRFLDDSNRDLAVERHSAIKHVPGDERVFMTESELRDVANREHVTVGNHTLTHPDLSELSDSDVRREIDEAKRCLESVTETNVRTFSYPFGGYSGSVFRRVKPVVAKNHDVAVTTHPGHVRTDTDPLLVPRVEAPLNPSALAFRLSVLFGTLSTWYRRAFR